MKTINKVILKKINALTNSSVERGMIVELIRKGRATTGSSSYSSGWAKKDIRTAAIVCIATSLGLKVEKGNNAPRGGANGEFVKVLRYTPTLNYLRKAINRAASIKQNREDSVWIRRAEQSRLEMANTIDKFPVITGRLKNYFDRKGIIASNISVKQANSIAWKKQNYVEGGCDIVTFRRLILDYFRDGKSIEECCNKPITGGSAEMIANLINDNK